MIRVYRCLFHKNMKSNNIHDLLKFYFKVKFLFGTVRVVSKHGSVIRVGIIYKIYSFLLGILFSSILLFTLKGFFKSVIKLPIPLMIAIASTFGVMAFTHIFVIFVNGTSFTSHCIKIYNELNKIGKIFCTRQNSNFIKQIYIHHLIYLLVKSITIGYEEYMSTKKKFIPQIISRIYHITIELDLLHYALEVNKVARCFEELNFHLLNDTQINMDIHNSIMFHLWKSKSYDFKQKLNLTQLMVVFNKLTNIVDDICRFYGTLLNLVILVLFFNSMSFISIMLSIGGDDKPPPSVMVIWCFMNILKIFVLTTSAEILQKNSERTVYIIGKLYINSKLVNRHDNVLEVFTSLISRKRIVMSDKVILFKIDYTIIFQFIEGIITYAILISNFKEKSNAIN